MIYHNRKKALRCTLSLLTVLLDNIDTSPSVLCSDQLFLWVCRKLVMKVEIVLAP